jgi:DNA invertase Pin-like site-specific DNA recombinase
MLLVTIGLYRCAAVRILPTPGQCKRGCPTLDLQRNALLAAGVAPERIYADRASERTDDRPGLATCLKALQPGDTLVVWKLDRLGREPETSHQRSR